MPSHPKLFEAIQRRMHELPVLSSVLVDLMRADPDSASYFDKVAKLVGSDPAFATRLLRLANSPASAPSRPITRLHEALTRLGCRQAVNLVLASSAANVFVPRVAWERELWRHAVAVGAIARKLAVAWAGPRIDPEHAYVCGLLHDLGRFVLYLEAPDEIRVIDETGWSTPQEMVRREFDACGFTHAQLGAIAATKWSLPESLVSLIREHHNEPPPEAEASTLLGLVRAADWIGVVIPRKLTRVAGPSTPRAPAEDNESGDEELATLLSAYRPIESSFWNQRVVRAVRDGLSDAEAMASAIGV